MLTFAEYMKKSATVGIIAAVIIAIGVVVAVFYGTGSTDGNNPIISTISQNTTNTGASQGGNNATTISAAQNTTGKHFNITLEEQVGIKQK